MQTDRQTYRPTGIHKYKHTDTQTGANKNTYNKYANIHAYMHTGRQAGRHADNTC